MNHTQLLFSVGAFVLGWVALAPTNAEALHRRYNASQCWSKPGLSPPSYNSDTGGTNYWDVRATGVGDQEVVCAIDDDSHFAKTQVTTLNIHGYDASSTSSVGARACRTYWGSVGGDCSYLVSSGGSFVGNYTLNMAYQLSLGYWNNSGDFGYVYLDLPANSSVRGYYMAN